MSKILAEIQAKIKAPKDKENTFGKYRYRNAEGILAAFKDVQPEGVSLVMSDAVTVVGQRMFLIATARLFEGDKLVAEASSAAMHATEKKGMDDAQITGACSSYARKYALCGLFAIDDSTDDPDSTDHREKAPKREPQRDAAPPKQDAPKPPTTPAQIADRLILRFNTFTTVKELTDFTDPDQPAGQAWDKLAKDDAEQSNRVKAAYEKRIMELTPNANG